MIVETEESGVFMKERFKAVSPTRFLEELRALDAPSLDKPLIERALAFADKAHDGQKRASGEAYIVHPVGVALILIELRMDSPSICAALLHDVLEDTAVTEAQLEGEFGVIITRLVAGVTKIGKLKFSSKAEEQAENLRKMLLAMTDDVRVILIKLADRLHNLFTLGALPPQKQRRIAEETLDIYTPLAHRLGTYRIKSEMEDLCLRYLEPNVYFDLVRRVAQKRRQREQFVQDVKAEIEQLLKENDLAGLVRGRSKSFYSIYKKTMKHTTDVADLYDLIGLRVITSSVADCYTVLGLLHERWKPLQNRFKDYIAVPKANQYQSLHTTVIHPSGQVVEVQIRTEEQDKVAEEGIAAHWSYKEGTKTAEDMRRKLAWLKQIIEWHKDVADSAEFIEGLKVDLFQNQVYVFTPEGKVLELPAGSTPLDFAYTIHTDVGHHCVGAQVNGKMVPLTYKLENSQIVNILTSKTSKGPSRDWLDVVQSTRAKQKINAWLKRENRDADLLKGRQMVQEELDKRCRELPDADVSAQSVLKSGDFAEGLQHYGFLDLDALAVAVARSEFSVNSLLNRLPIFMRDVAQEAAERALAEQPKIEKRPGTKGILVGGQGDMMVRLSKCCNPILGDPIVGYVTRGRGVSVHRTDCPNAKALAKDAERKVDVGWDEGSLARKDTFLVEVEVHVLDRPNTLLRVTNIISQFKLNIYTANARTMRKGQEGVLTYTIDVANQTQLENLLDAVRSLPEVLRAFRVRPGEQQRAAKALDADGDDD